MGTAKSKPSEQAIASFKRAKDRVLFLRGQDESYSEYIKGYGMTRKYELLHWAEEWERAYLWAWPCLYDDTCQF